MKTLPALVTGVVIGFAIQTAAQVPPQNGRIVYQPVTTSPNQFGVSLLLASIAVPDLQKAEDFYTKTMGFPLVLRRVVDDNGTFSMSLLRVSQDTFLEFQSVTPQRPAGLVRIQLKVDDPAKAAATWKERGANVLAQAPAGRGPNNLVDPFGMRIEFTTGRAQQGPPDPQR